MQESDEQQPSSIILGNQGENDADQLIPSATGMCVCVFSNANPLHYYMLLVLPKADRWRWVWSIFESRTAWADHITYGTSICYSELEKVKLGWLYV